MERLFPPDLAATLIEPILAFIAVIAVVAGGIGYGKRASRGAIRSMSRELRRMFR